MRTRGKSNLWPGTPSVCWIGVTYRTIEREHQNLSFLSQYLDRETELHYNTVRYYDADVGQLICIY